MTIKHAERELLSSRTLMTAIASIVISSAACAPRPSKYRPQNVGGPAALSSNDYAEDQRRDKMAEELNHLLNRLLPNRPEPRYIARLGRVEDKVDRCLELGAEIESLPQVDQDHYRFTLARNGLSQLRSNLQKLEIWREHYREALEQLAMVKRETRQLGERVGSTVAPVRIADWEVSLNRANYEFVELNSMTFHNSKRMVGLDEHDSIVNAFSFLGFPMEPGAKSYFGTVGNRLAGLSIVVKVWNRSSERINSFLPSLIFSDELGNVYRFDRSKLQDAYRIRPGDSRELLLFFPPGELPVQAAKTLYVRFPESTFGRPFNLEFPADALPDWRDFEWEISAPNYAGDGE